MIYRSDAGHHLPPIASLRDRTHRLPMAGGRNLEIAGDYRKMAHDGPFNRKLTYIGWLTKLQLSCPSPPLWCKSTANKLFYSRSFLPFHLRMKIQFLKIAALIASLFIWWWPPVMKAKTWSCSKINANSSILSRVHFVCIIMAIGIKVTASLANCSRVFKTRNFLKQNYKNF